MNAGQWPALIMDNNHFVRLFVIDSKRQQEDKQVLVCLMKENKKLIS